MSKQTFNSSRRGFLKSAAYASVLSAGGLSSLAFASDSPSTSMPLSQLSNVDIAIMQQQMMDKEVVTLFNQSDKTISLNALQPISLQQLNSSIVVKVNQVDASSKQGAIHMAPSQRIAFEIEAIGADFVDAKMLPMPSMAGDFLQVSSEHAAFNNIVAVSPLSQQIA